MSPTPQTNLSPWFCLVDYQGDVRSSITNVTNITDQCPLLHCRSTSAASGQKALCSGPLRAAMSPQFIPEEWPSGVAPPLAASRGSVTTRSASCFLATRLFVSCTCLLVLGPWCLASLGQYAARPLPSKMLVQLHGTTWQEGGVCDALQVGLNISLFSLITDHYFNRRLPRTAQLDLNTPTCSCLYVQTTASLSVSIELWLLHTAFVCLLCEGLHKGAS